MIQMILNNSSMSLMAVCVLCVIISVITELFKPFISEHMPTELFVIVLSIAVCVIFYLSLCSYFNMLIVWYESVASVIVGLLISFITMYGWDKFFDIVDKYRKYIK